MTEFSNFLTALSGFAWPALVLAVGVLFSGRDQIAISPIPATTGFWRGSKMEGF
jgi:hypothetical protein